MKKVNLYYEPRQEIFSKIEQYPNEPEMSEFESAFLCGLIREKMPKKLVEVGVAAGGTTAIIIQCLAELGISKKCRAYSVDYSRQFYRDRTKLSGFLGQQAKQIIGNEKFNHEFCLGGLLPEFIDKITADSKKVDFLILDTMHIVPGEILDFLAIFHSLENGAIVVLHDVALNHEGHEEAICTKLLFDTVVADKIVMDDPERCAKYANIAAFMVNEDTRKYIYNVFSSLTLPWEYMLTEKEIAIYREKYEMEYDQTLVELFDKAVKLNEMSLQNKHNLKRRIKKIGKLALKG